MSTIGFVGSNGGTSGVHPLAPTYGDVHVIVLRADWIPDRWSSVIVPVRGAGNLVHSMLDFANRIAGMDGSINAATCIPEGS